MTLPSCDGLVAVAEATRRPLAVKRRGRLVLVTDNPAARSVRRRVTAQR